jgi:hypothetical protein
VGQSEPKATGQASDVPETALGALANLEQLVEQWRERAKERASPLNARRLAFEECADELSAVLQRQGEQSDVAACTNCGESAKPRPVYADFVGPFCEGCWDRLREHFTSGAICAVCKYEHDRETSDCRVPAERQGETKDERRSGERVDQRLADKTRAVMQRIADNNLTTVNRCPSLLAFGPIYDALAAVEADLRAQLATVTAENEKLITAVAKDVTRWRDLYYAANVAQEQAEARADAAEQRLREVEWKHDDRV